MNIEKPHFIVIDDNGVDCFIAKKIIESSGKSQSCSVFRQANEALEYIERQRKLTASIIIFVDIQMPVMNGFEFLNAFEFLSPEIKDYCHIYILSSSINEKDIAKAKMFDSVKRFIGKPVTKDIIINVVKDTAR